jgi:FtsP/CotA-like multicopper oxidase with cupredoxin domain
MRRAQRGTVFLVSSASGAAVLAGCGGSGSALTSSRAVSLQSPIEGRTIPAFVNPLPTLGVAGGTIASIAGNGSLTIRMCEFWANVLPPGTFVAGDQPKTRVWGYVGGESCPRNGPNDPALDTYIGPVIVSERSNPGAAPRPPTTITWVNDLGTTATTQVLAYKASTDQTLHWADPSGLECAGEDGAPTFGTRCALNYAGPIPAVVHLHGGAVPPALDGGPDAWFSSVARPGYRTQGAAYYSQHGDEGNQAVYAYPNVQEAAPLWFHDDTLGTTSLGLYSGLAGVYLVVDPELRLPAGLTAEGLRGPKGTETATIPLVIQDRAFDTSGQLFYPANGTDGAEWSPSPEHPYWNPGVFLDTIVVNGKAWPFLDVEPKRYRFLVIDASNSRAYSLSLVDAATGAPGPPLWVIGGDEGYLEAPVAIDSAVAEELLVMPGERYDVIVDFSGVAPGTRLLLRNSASAPYPGGAPPDPATTARVVQFRVGTCHSGACDANDPSYDPSSGVPIRSGANAPVRFADATGTLVPAAPVQTVRALTLDDVSVPPSTVESPVTGEQTRYPGGSVALLLNNTRWSGESSRPYQDFTPMTLNGTTIALSEVPREGDAELWELVNLTAEAHPIHTHLAAVQIVNRQAFDVDAYRSAYDATFPGGTFVPGFGPPLDYRTGNGRALGGNPDVTPFLTGTAEPPARQEAGWKDTVTAPPGQVTRIVVRFAPTSLAEDALPAERAYPFDPSDGFGYPWSCQITTHEDNEMIRPFRLSPNPAAPPPTERLLRRGREY